MTSLSLWQIRRRRRWLGALLLALLAVGSALPCAAEGHTVPGPWGALVDHEGPLKLETAADRITHLRRQRMRAISAHFRALEAAVAYSAPASREEMAADAAALLFLADTLARSFAEPTPAPTGRPGARPVIWEERDKLARHIDGFRNSVVVMSRAIDSGTGLGEAVVGIRHQCLACHQSYREFPQRR